jgi:hypothetical protein
MKDESTMNHRTRPIVLVLLSSFIFHPSSLVRADGGALRLHERAGNYQVAVFTSPTPFRAGLVDISVLVQDAAAGECVADARMTVRLTARGSGLVVEYPAKTEAASNKLFHAAVFQLPESGWWDVDVVVEGPHGSELVRFAVEAEEALPRWAILWPWFGWPALAVALFGIHQVLVRRRGKTRTVRSRAVAGVAQRPAEQLELPVVNAHQADDRGPAYQAGSAVLSSGSPGNHPQSA